MQCVVNGCVVHPPSIPRSFSYVIHGTPPNGCERIFTNINAADAANTSAAQCYKPPSSVLRCFSTGVSCAAAPEPHAAVAVNMCVAGGLWLFRCGLWLFRCGLCLVACGLWLVSCGLCLVACVLWLVACGLWLVACGSRHVAVGVTCGLWQCGRVSGVCQWLYRCV
jgi:hypothetical protein